MTSIKPPGSGPVDLPTAPHPAEGAVSGPGASASAEASAGAEHVAGQAQVGGSGDLVGALSRDLQAGKLTMDQALDALVERAAARMGTHLSSQERAELLTVLRTTLASDPTLAALRDAAR